MENSNLIQEEAIKEIGKGYDILKQLQGLLQLKSRKGEGTTHLHELAEPLFRDGLQSLNYALSIMRSGVAKAGVKSEIVVIESAVHESNQITANERGKRRRQGEDSWIIDTTMPYDDGFQWRKYGDKKINGTNLSRGYFRCTHKEQGCEAKKVVQQTSNANPHLFKVTYTNNHTCKFLRTIHPASSAPPSLLNHSSCSSQAIITDTSTSASMIDGNCDWELDSFFKDLASDDPFILGPSLLSM